MIFSTVYTVVFFMSIGCMTGAVEKAELAMEKMEISSFELAAMSKYNISSNHTEGGSVLKQLR